MSRLSKWCLLLMIGFGLSQASCEKGADMASAKQSGAGGSLARFAIVGNHLYIVSHAELDVYDMSDPAKPALKNTMFVGFNIETIFPYNDKLFMGGEFGMYIYSLAQPDKPVREGSVQHFRACDPVVSNDTLAYVTLKAASRCGSFRNMLHVYNVKDIKSPILIYEQEMKSPGGLGIKDRALYVCQAENGLAIFDLNNAMKPNLIKEFTDEAYYDVIPYGNVLITYVKDGIRFFDITNPLNPTLLSEVKG